jgi:hypothetical protein
MRTFRVWMWLGLTGMRLRLPWRFYRYCFQTADIARVRHLARTQRPDARAREFNAAIRMGDGFADHELAMSNRMANELKPTIWVRFPHYE